LARFRETVSVTEADLNHLPAPVQKYVRSTGAVGRPRVHNVRAVFAGQFRNGLKGRWMAFRSEQYNFFDQPERFFLMRASMFGIPAEGLHMFRGGKATMEIKLASLFQVVNAAGPEMNQGETVTIFNDMCLMAPSALIDREKIRWEEDGPLAVLAWFTHAGITISARLSFSESGELTNFVSNERFLSSDGKTFQRLPWSTPARAYRGGLVSCADVVWHTPEGEFVYGKFNLAEIEYNLTRYAGCW
jgi:hypothetical protein